MYSAGGWYNDGGEMNKNSARSWALPGAAARIMPRAFLPARGRIGVGQPGLRAGAR